MVPVAGQDAVFDRASMERKSKMGATVIEGKHLFIVIDDEQWTASAANDDHTRGLELLQRRHTNETSGAGGKLFADPYFGHAVQWLQKRPRCWFLEERPSSSSPAAREAQPPSNLPQRLDASPRQAALQSRRRRCGKHGNPLLP
jgi:hypothetical protein